MAEVRRFELSAWNAIVGLGTGERFVRATDYDALAAEAVRQLEETEPMRKRIRELEAQLAEYIEQAELGLLTEHESCPAAFACAFIVADSDGKKPCPRPFNGRPEGFTKMQCFEAGECGCTAKPTAQDRGAEHGS